jgi:hypothetical protein
MSQTIGAAATPAGRRGPLLYKVFVEARLPPCAKIFGTGVASHGDEEDAGQSGHGKQVSGDFKAVHTGQADIEEMNSIPAVQSSAFPAD